MPFPVPRARKASNQPPTGFAVDRTRGVGRHPLLSVFPGLDALPAFLELGRRDPGGTEGLRLTEVEVVPQDVWMYVAPSSPSELKREGWNPVYSGDKDVVVIGGSHLVESPGILLYLDVLHELCHVAQRHRGLKLWESGKSYVDRPTEIEAYQFAIDEAHRLGATTPFLREYLRVEWVSEEDYQRLLERMGIGAP